MRKTAILIVVGLCSLFYNAEVIFAENSAVFRIVSTVPPSVQAGREIVFVVRITNTGTEGWVSGEYLVKGVLEHVVRAALGSNPGSGQN